MQRSTFVAFATCFVFGVLVAAPVRADDESDRRSIMSQIDSKLDNAASKLSGLDRKSDAGDVDDAQRSVGEIERLVDDLKRVKGSDGGADRIVSNYPGYVRDFRGASDALKALKLRQPKGEDYARWCKAFDAEMTARANATKDDPSGAEDLSALAKSIGRKGEELMSEAERQRNEVERARDDAKRFSPSEGRWANVRTNLSSSADDIARAWRDNYDRAKSACEEVVKRERHREVERALGKLGNSRAGRADLRRKIDELLGTLTDRVKDVDSQSDNSYVRGAIEITKELDSQLERLRNAAGDDTESRRIASAWPSWVKELRESLEALSELKFNQRRADGADDKCEAAEKSLQEQLRRYVGDPTLHERALKDLPDEAARVGNPIKSGIDKAGDFDRQMESWSNKARAFSQSDGPWSRVSSNLRDSGERVFRYWRDRLDRMKRACARIVLGSDNPDVRRAVDEMSRDTRSAGDRYRNLRDEFNRWKGEVSKLREFTTQDVAEIRREFCLMGDYDDLASVNAVADRWASQLSSIYGSLTGSADRIKRAADELIAKRRALKAAPKVKEAVDAILESIAKIKDYQLRGSNNPLLRARIEYGKKEHRSIQNNTSSCDASEIAIDGSYCRNPDPKRDGCRLDCVKGCTIIEIKPCEESKSCEAEDMGLRQATAYVVGLQRMYAAQGTDMFKERFARFKACLSPDNKSLELTPRVVPYPFCPKAADIAPSLENADPSIPSESE